MEAQEFNSYSTYTSKAQEKRQS